MSTRRVPARQTSGRTFRALSPSVHGVAPVVPVRIRVSDGTTLAGDLHLPAAPGPGATTPAAVRTTLGGLVPDRGPAFAPDRGRGEPQLRWPTLVSFSCYPRQVQDLPAPLGFVEAGDSGFFVSRGYAHLVVNARGTGGSEGEFGLADARERRDVHDVVEWAAGQPWSDGHVGGMGISYFAFAQLGAATLRPPHLDAIFPFATLGDMYDAVWHNGVRSSGFADAWLAAVATLGGRDDAFWSGHRLRLVRRLLARPAVQRALPEGGGADAVRVLRRLFRRVPPGPFADLWRRLAVEHPTRDAWWDDRSLRAGLAEVDIPVYLGCQWDNVPMHLPGTVEVWDALRHNSAVRMTLVDEGALQWPWSSLHVEALAWFDHWLKGRDTGIMDGPPVRYVVPGEGRWRTASTWPPPEAELTAYALGADGELAPVAADTAGGAESGVHRGSRTYMHAGAGTSGARVAQSGAPDRLVWRSAVLAGPLVLAGDLELVLDATITALDTSFVVLLQDEDPSGSATTITAGWLRAQLRTVDVAASRPGRPVVPCREPLAVEPGALTRYRIPLVPNARRLDDGHRLRLTVASTDRPQDGTAVLGFTHTPVGEPSVTTVHASSRLLVPLLPAAAEEDASV